MKRYLIAVMAAVLASASLLYADFFTELKTKDLHADRVHATRSALGPVLATQVIAATNTIAADACGGIKRISSATAVTTNTTNTFTAPAAANTGCIMQVCNVNAADAITLDDNALFNASGVAGATPGDTVLGALDCCSVGSTGAVWNQLGPCSQN